MPRNISCNKCELCKGVKNVCIWGEGPVPCDIMIVGRDPGENEDVLGRPFVGPAGKMLDQLLVHGNIDRSKVYITNITKCRPPGNRQPTPDEKNVCQNYLLEEILAVNPKVIVTLGGDALEAITGLDKVMKIAGTTINIKKETFGKPEVFQRCV